MMRFIVQFLYPDLPTEGIFLQLGGDERARCRASTSTIKIFAKIKRLSPFCMSVIDVLDDVSVPEEAYRLIKKYKFLYSNHLTMTLLCKF